MRLRMRVDRLEQRLPAPSPVDLQRNRPWSAVVRRFCALLGAAEPLLDACPCCGAYRYDTSWPDRALVLNLPWKALDGWAGERRDVA